MPEYLRVRDKEAPHKDWDPAEYSVVVSAFDKENTIALKEEPGADANGDPLPDKPAAPKSSAPAAAKKEK